MGREAEYRASSHHIQLAWVGQTFQKLPRGGGRNAPRGKRMKENGPPTPFSGGSPCSGLPPRPGRAFSVLCRPLREPHPHPPFCQWATQGLKFHHWIRASAFPVKVDTLLKEIPYVQILKQ